jgi:antitoxin (DNA-binding transcriptional repressor) of toxin-antitoxin stability system
MDATLTELRRTPRPALNALRAGNTVYLTEHGRPIGALVPGSPAPISGLDLADRMRRHRARSGALETLAKNMEGLR